jgi:hypothetical protein
MFSADIGDEGSFSACTIIFAASSALAVLAVLDDPDCTVGKFSMPVILGLAEPETRRVSPSRHRRGDIPTIRVGKLLRVPIAAMDRKLESAGRS